MGGRDMRLPAPVLILPSWLSRHQVELVNGHVQVSGTHRSMEDNSTRADHDSAASAGLSQRRIAALGRAEATAFFGAWSLR